jgi:hypothetical protein
MKDAGLRDVRSVRRRARRLLALDRVLPEDVEYITARLDEVEARIISMQEFNEFGKEEN